MFLSSPRSYPLNFDAQSSASLLSPRFQPETNAALFRSVSVNDINVAPPINPHPANGGSSSVMSPLPSPTESFLTSSVNSMTIGSPYQPVAGTAVRLRVAPLLLLSFRSLRA